MAVTDDLRRRMHHEHRTLRVLQEDLLDRFESFCEERSSERHRDFVGVFEDFRASLQRHFEFEEEGGYMQQVLDRRPHHKTKVDMLQREHREIRVVLDRLESELATDLTDDLPRCDDFKKDFVDLMTRFGRHEQAERELVMEVFWLEGGVSD